MKLFAILILLSTCSTPSVKQSNTGSPDNQPDKEISSVQKMDTMTVKKDSEFVIEIRASLGTGYRWMLEDSLDKKYLSLIRSTIVTDSTEMAARPDLQTFVFKALQSGSSTISFVYKRPWKKNADTNAERKNYLIKII